ncbi:MAG: hypothetical protein QOE81_176, partial [Verrucomicrobiota bacterium]
MDTECRYQYQSRDEHSSNVAEGGNAGEQSGRAPGRFSMT